MRCEWLWLSRAGKPGKKHIEDCRMHGPAKLEPRGKAFNPTDMGLQGLQPLEFYPDRFVQHRPLDELYLAAIL